MVACAKLLELEMRCLDIMPRHQLLEALRERCDCLPCDLLERVEGQATDRLRLLLFAARLIYALRQLQQQERARLPRTRDGKANSFRAKIVSLRFAKCQMARGETGKEMDG